MKQRVELTTMDLLHAVFGYLERKGVILQGHHYNIRGPYHSRDDDGGNLFGFDVSDEGATPVPKPNIITPVEKKEEDPEPEGRNIELGESDE